MSKEPLNPEEAWQVANIAPSDLYYTEFRRTLFGGYDREEVNAFREHVGDLFESMLSQMRETKERMATLEKDVAAYHEMEEALRNALKSSQKFSETILDTARREADALLAEASLAYSRAQNQARDMPEQLRSEIAELQGARDRMRQDLLSLIEAHRSIVTGILPAEQRGGEESSQGSRIYRSVSARLRSFNFGPRAKPEVVPMQEDPFEGVAAPGVQEAVVQEEEHSE